MNYTMFCVVTTAVYIAAICYLVMEYRRSHAGQRHELQSLPLILSSTMLYIVLLVKTHQLLQM